MRILEVQHFKNHAVMTIEADEGKQLFLDPQTHPKKFLIIEMKEKNKP